MITPATLRDGSTTADRRLDRIARFDPKSRDFPITATIDLTKPRTKTWRGGPVTNQGREGACVGHGTTGELTALPVRVKFADPQAYAFTAYHDFQHRDPWPGCHLGSRCPVAPTPDSKNYDGTEVLTAMKVLTERGFYSEYRWAFGLDDLILALSHVGPAVLGIPWHEGMYDAPGGKVKVTGDKVGGHCILARGVSLPRKAVLLRNSWGREWGIGGDAWISFADLETLLHDDGEACVPVRSALLTG